MAVDKHWRLYYNTAKLADWSALQVGSVLYHEAHHLLRNHPERAEAMHVSLADAMTWNKAADAEINDDLKSENGVELPGNYILPENIGQDDGGLAETYYRNIKKDAEGELPQGGGNGAPEPGSGHGEDGHDLHDCGSAAGGGQRSWEDGPPSKDSPGVDAGRQIVIRNKVAQDIMEQVHARGNVPGHWERWAQDIVAPKVRWQRELAARVRNAVAFASGQQDYTWRKISRRQSASPRIRMPAMQSPKPRIAVVVDTSGSMTASLLNTAMSELKGVLRSTGVSTGVPVIACDADVHSDKTVFSISQVDLGGGGGTDMGVGLDHAAKIKPRPEVVVVMTDMMTPWPDESPPFRTIICDVTGRKTSSRRWSPPDWADKIIRVEE